MREVTRQRFVRDRFASLCAESLFQIGRKWKDEEE